MIKDLTTIEKYEKLKSDFNKYTDKHLRLTKLNQIIKLGICIDDEFVMDIIPCLDSDFDLLRRSAMILLCESKIYDEKIRQIITSKIIESIQYDKDSDVRLYGFIFLNNLPKESLKIHIPFIMRIYNNKNSDSSNVALAALVLLDKGNYSTIKKIQKDFEVEEVEGLEEDISKYYKYIPSKNAKILLLNLKEIKTSKEIRIKENQAKIDTFQKISHRYNDIAFDELVQLLKFQDEIELKKWLLDVPKEIVFQVGEGKIIFNNKQRKSYFCYFCGSPIEQKTKTCPD